VQGRRVEPEHHDLVTIFFSDIVGFTDISTRMKPERMMELLDRLYHAIDSLALQYNVFKVFSPPKIRTHIFFFITLKPRVQRLQGLTSLSRNTQPCTHHKTWTLNPAPYTLNPTRDQSPHQVETIHTQVVFFFITLKPRV